jgi:tetratricopeptide (TPR) repeat protein
VDSSNNEIISLIPDWLTLTREADIPLGLSREEAFKRARELRRLLRDRRMPAPTAIEPDEDFKDVLHALVLLLSDSAASQSDGLLEEADAVYQFILRIDWGDDDFDEQRLLLRQCAEIGWQSVGISIADTAAFRRRQPSEEARESALAFLTKGPEESGTHEADRSLSDPDEMSAVCELLGKSSNSDPRLVAERASAVNRWLKGQEGKCGLFDERDYFLGETARLAANAFRLLGNHDDAEAWLQRAEAGFRHTVNPGPLMAQVAYLRLALAYERHRNHEVLELLPSLLKNFEKFGMRSEAAKTHFLEAMTLKDCSRNREAFDKFTSLAETLDQTAEPVLLGQAFVEVGAFLALEGQYDKAIASYQKALPLLSQSGSQLFVAHLKMTVGETFGAQGNHSSAAKAYREGIELYAEIGMVTYVAYCRVVRAETLIALGRHREAEWEILAALPTIEEQKMVPEGFMATALLRESVSRRQANPNALRELREQLRQLHG